MTDITLKNFRCFGYEQKAPLAPLTLLVGENSTGKTSFMAMIRALWDLVFNGDEPNFNKLPYDLGSFHEIVRDDPDAIEERDFFGAGCSLEFYSRGTKTELHSKIDVEFSKDGSIPVLNRLTVSHNKAWIECAKEFDSSGVRLGVSCGIHGKTWDFKPRTRRSILSEYGDESVLSYLRAMGSIMRWELSDTNKKRDALIARDGTSKPTVSELRTLQNLSINIRTNFSRYGEAYASAPVRSSPQRTYEVSQSIRDVEGRYVPKYLAYLHDRGGDEWNHLKEALEEFGRSSGLFDQISIEKLGDKGGVPFQVKIGFSQNGMAVRDRNLIDVGYGVSQALPVLTEVMHRDARHLLLFQQPEVHLHPRAQAALGSLFCKIAGKDRQIIVETHSDYILDRVRIDIRDQKCELQHHNVAILFFDRSGPSVKIHRINLDPAGNIVDPPLSYRQFFMQETNRLIGY